MAWNNPLFLGLLIAGLGLLLWIGAVILLRFSRPRVRVTNTPVEFLEPNGQEDNALLLLMPGGKIRSLNPAAVRLFNVRPGELPALETLVRQARPSEALLQICAGEAPAPFRISGQWVQAESWDLQVEGQNLRAVALHVQSSNLSTELMTQAGSHTIKDLNALGQLISASLNLSETVESVLKVIETHIACDFCQMALWDSRHERYTAYRLAAAEGSEQLEVDAPALCFSEAAVKQMASERTSIRVADMDASPLGSGRSRRTAAMQAYLAAPLWAGAKFVGVLELGATTPNAFQETDQDLLELIAGQSAIAVRNAALYEKEQTRSTELDSLAQLARAYGSARTVKEVLGNLLEAIHPIVKVNILGFLLYNENQHALEGQAPFYGFPEQFLPMYQIQVPPNGPLEQALLGKEPLVSANAREDAEFERLGLAPMAITAGLADTVMMPLVTGGRVFGYLQAANHLAGPIGFSAEELHLVQIIANQTAPVIDNAILVQQSRQRAQRAEGLRRIASLASSAATMTEILRYSLLEIARLLQADLAMVFLIDASGTALLLDRASRYGNYGEATERFTHLAVDDAQFPFTATGSQHSFVIGSDEIEEQPLPPFYTQLRHAWNVKSLIVAPLLVRNKGIGEIWIASRQDAFFDGSDAQMVVTSAGQLAGVVERGYLMLQTDETLRRRIDQLTALTRITRELSGSLDLTDLLQIVHAEALRTTQASSGSIYYFGNGFSGSGHIAIRFWVGDAPRGPLSDFEYHVLESEAPQILATGEGDSLDYQPPHNGVRATLFVPVFIKNQAAGLIELHSDEKSRFDALSVEITQALAAQAAIAFSNAVQHSELEQRSSLLSRQMTLLSELFQISNYLRPGQPLVTALGEIAQSILDATPFRMVLVSRYDPKVQGVRRLLNKGMPEDAWQEISAQIQPWSGIQQYCQPQYQVGSLYFIPSDRQPLVPERVHFVTVLPESMERHDHEWHADDLLFAPLIDSQGQPLGLLSVDAPADGLRPDHTTLSALELLVRQAALLLENQNIIERLQLAEHAELETMSGSKRAGFSAFCVELSLDLAADAALRTGRDEVLDSQARLLLQRMGLTTAFVAQSVRGEERMTAWFGDIPAGLVPEALFGQRNPLRQVLQTGTVLIIPDITTENEWANSPLVSSLNVRSLIALAYPFESDRSAAVMAIGHEPFSPQILRDQELFERACAQVSINLQNLELTARTHRRLEEVNHLLEFSRKLGTLDQSRILESLVESVVEVVSRADAGWVGLVDEQRQMVTVYAARGYSNTEKIIGMHCPLQGDVLTLAARAVVQAAPLRVGDIDFSQDYNLPAEDLLAYQTATGHVLPLGALAAPLMLGDRVLGVLVAERFVYIEPFSDADLQLAYSLAQQTALALENARLFNAAQRRTEQLQALTRSAGELSASLSSASLVDIVLDQLAQALAYDTAALWLRKEDQLTIAAASGFEDNAARLGISTAIRDSALFQQMDREAQPLSIPDVRLDERFQTLPEHRYLSWLGIPLRLSAGLTGVIALEKSEAHSYSSDDLQIAATFAGQAAIALENEQLYIESVQRATELDQRSSRLALLGQVSAELGATLDEQLILRITCERLAESLSTTAVAVVLENADNGFLLSAEYPVPPIELLPMQLPASEFWAQINPAAGFIRIETLEDDRLGELRAYFQQRAIQSLAAVALSAGSDHLGWVLLQSKEPRHFNSAEIDLAHTICNQAAVAYSNASHYAETRRLKDDLEARVIERTQALVVEHSNTQTLLRVTTELSASLDLQQVLTRSLTILNEALNTDESLILISGNGQVVRVGSDLLVNVNTQGSGARMEMDINRMAMRKRQPVLIDDIQNNDFWNPGGDFSRAYHSLAVLPLILGEDVLGVLMLAQRSVSFFTQNQLDLLEGVARQIGIALNNAELFKLIRDQSENLGGMLREQQIQFSRSRAILEAVADGVVVTDPEMNVTLFNRSAEQILTVRATQIVTQKLDELNKVMGGTGSGWIPSVERWSALRSETQGGESFAEQVTLNHGRVVSIHSAPVYWRAEFQGSVSIFRDMTHQAQVEKLKSEFIANVSHELRTPLTSIKGYVDILLMGAAGEITSQQNHFLTVVKENSARLQVLVNDLLDVSRIQSGRVRLDIKPLDVCALIEPILSEMRRRANDLSKPTTFLLDCSPDTPWARGDEERLQQVLRSLVMNAFNYSPSGSTVRVRTSLAEGNLLQVDVIDKGIGIPAKDQGRIFDRFFRGDDPLVMQTAGTGLGLALAKILIEMQDGKIWFTSSGIAGEGSTFSFTLPAFQPRELTQGSAAEQTQP